MAIVPTKIEMEMLEALVKLGADKPPGMHVADPAGYAHMIRHGYVEIGIGEHRIFWGNEEKPLVETEYRIRLTELGKECVKAQ